MCRGPRKKAQPWSVCVRACVDQQCGVGVRVDLDFPPSGPFHQEVECIFRLLSFTNRKRQRRRPVSAEAGLGQATASPPASPGAQPPALGKPEERHGQARRTETQAPTDPAASRPAVDQAAFDFPSPECPARHHRKQRKCSVPSQDHGD